MEQALHHFSAADKAELPEIFAIEQASDQRIELVGKSREELADVFRLLGEPEKSLKMRVSQLWHWMYERGARDFDEMTTIAKTTRKTLEENCKIYRPQVSLDQQSEDGTRKWLLRCKDGKEVEAVHIPEDDRGALCVSSQVGCTLNCSFCHTGTMKLVRNLAAHEILGQFMLARDVLGEWNPARSSANSKLTNIVMMGMGEPLYNFENVKTALKIVMDGDGLALSRRRITLSTSGVVPMMQRCGAELNVNLAVSLHAVNDELRDVLVPLNRKYPIKELMQACRTYPGVSNARRITFEYVMLKGVNDSLADAREFVRLLKNVPAKVNLIPFNPWPGSEYKTSDWKQINAFAQVMLNAGYASPIRTPRGRDILAACGQLKSTSERGRREKVDLVAAE